jgi:hypothetical protein
LGEGLKDGFQIFPGKFTKLTAGEEGYTPFSINQAKIGNFLVTKPSLLRKMVEFGVIRYDKS